MAKNSVGLTDSNYEMLKKVASDKNTSLSGFVNTILKEFAVENKDEKVILTVPSLLTKRNKEQLREWLQLRMNAIIAAYYPEKERSECR